MQFSGGSGFVPTMAHGALAAYTAVITRIARRISLSVWPLQKRLERFEAFFDQGLTQLRLHAHAVRLVKRMYRAHKYIHVIIDFCTVRGSFGVGKVKLKKVGETPSQGFDILTFEVSISSSQALILLALCIKL